MCLYQNPVSRRSYNYKHYDSLLILCRAAVLWHLQERFVALSSLRMTIGLQETNPILVYGNIVELLRRCQDPGPRKHPR